MKGHILILRKGQSPLFKKPLAPDTQPNAVPKKGALTLP